MGSKVYDNPGNAQLAKIFAALCVRNNTSLEDLHAGYFPISKTGDYSDVKVIDGEGNVIPWNDLSRLSDEEMKIFIKKVVDNAFTFLACMHHKDFMSALALGAAWSQGYDDPILQKDFLRKVKPGEPLI